MLAIRLQRIGKKKIAIYRIIVSEKTKDTQGTYLEQVGTYNPHAKENQFLPLEDRVKYWISKGAVPSDTIHNLLVSTKVIEGKKAKSVFISKKRAVKIAAKKKAE